MQNTQIHHINNLAANFDCELIKAVAEQFVIFCDDNIKMLYGIKLLKSFEKRGLKVNLVSFKAGEDNKTRKTKESLENELFKLNIRKKSAFIALGGGVTCDLIGFLAATYLRGVNVIYIPTTLLAMADAAIGGKVGLNTSFGKNLIGSFYLPSMIFIDLTFLNTLSMNELMNGYVEMLKHGLICSFKHFQKVSEYFEKEKIPSIELILESIKLKQKIVAQDYLDKDIRQLLNFGHTFGHAIESLSNFKISHGRAVAIGILMESYLSMKINRLKNDDFLRIVNTFKSFKFEEKFTFEMWKKALEFDKKNTNCSIEFVALNAIGKIDFHVHNVTHPLSDIMLDDAINWINKPCFSKC